MNSSRVLLSSHSIFLLIEPSFLRNTLFSNYNSIPNESKIHSDAVSFTHTFLTTLGLGFNSFDIFHTIRKYTSHPNLVSFTQTFFLNRLISFHSSLITFGTSFFNSDFFFIHSKFSPLSLVQMRNNSKSSGEPPASGSFEGCFFYFILFFLFYSERRFYTRGKISFEQNRV